MLGASDSKECCTHRLSLLLGSSIQPPSAMEMSSVPPSWLCLQVLRFCPLCYHRSSVKWLMSAWVCVLYQNWCPWQCNHLRPTTWTHSFSIHLWGFKGTGSLSCLFVSLGFFLPLFPSIHSPPSSLHPHSRQSPLFFHTPLTTQSSLFPWTSPVKR